MKLSTVLTVVSAGIASSRTVSVPDARVNDVDDLSIADGEMPPGEKIPGQNPFNLCKGDHGHDAVCATRGLAFLVPRCSASRTPETSQNRSFQCCAPTGTLLIQVAQNRPSRSRSSPGQKVNLAVQTGFKLLARLTMVTQGREPHSRRDRKCQQTDRAGRAR